MFTLLHKGSDLQEVMVLRQLSTISVIINQ